MIVGVLGGGQLGRMLALAGYPLDIQCRFYDPSAEAPAGQVAPLATGAFRDLKRLAAFAGSVEVLTFDWENVPVETVRALARFTRVAPPVAALEHSQDRLLEKCLFRDLGIPTPAFAPVDLRCDLEVAARHLGLPGVVKTRRLGYDGKGQVVVRRRRDLASAWEQLRGAALIYEAFVVFRAELSLVAVRSRAGRIAYYPLSRNVHADGMLASSRAPYRHEALERAARRYVRRLLEHFRYVGVIAVEFFVTRDGLLANEMAPRVHNSGHWTIEGAVTSQFENHLRAISGLPLGETRAIGHAAMVNLITRLPSARRLLQERGVHWHDYGKTARPGRKLGHATVIASTATRADRALRRLLRLREG